MTPLLFFVVFVVFFAPLIQLPVALKVGRHTDERSALPDKNQNEKARVPLMVRARQ